MKITLWKGYHGARLAQLVAQAWDQQELLILCPPLLKDFSFLRAMPPGPTVFQGDWPAKPVVVRAGAALPFTPTLGVFTSGTLSASPRLVLYSKRNVTVALDAVFDLFDQPIEHVFCYPQAFHTFGLTLGYVAAHRYGWRLHTPHGKYSRTSHADRLNLREARVLTLGTPTHFHDLLEVVKEGATLAPSYACIMGGAGVSKKLWQQTRDLLKIASPSIGYGCTEAAPGITHLPPGSQPTSDNEIGLPLPSLKSEITGEGVSIEGPSLCEAIVQNGKIEFPRKLIIRDRVRLLENGHWAYDGRLDLLLNRGGQKFSLESIENRLRESLGASVIAVAVRDDRLGEDLGLVVCLDGDQENYKFAAQDVLARDFALRVSSGRLKFIGDFPLNESAKLDRRALSSLFVDDP